MDDKEKLTNYMTFDQGEDNNGKSNDHLDQEEQKQSNVKDSDSDLGTNHGKITVEQAIDHMGFGWFQIKFGLLCGFSWIADSMETMALSILGPILICEWGISDAQEALITTLVFVGFLIGSPIVGVVADMYGRRLLLIIANVWTVIFGIASAFSPTFTWFLTLRTIVGTGISAECQVVTYFSEYLTSKTRAKAIVLIAGFWSIGAMMEAALALVIIPASSWRYWLVATAAPLVLFLFGIFFFPESAKYYAATAQPEKARAALECVAKSNKVPLPEGEILTKLETHRGRPQDLFNSEHRRTSIMQLIFWFNCAFCYYGLVLITTEFIQLGNTCFDSIKDKENHGCVPLTTTDYLNLIWTSAAEVPGLFITVVLVDVIGRRWTIIFNSVLFSLMCFLLMICMSNTLMLIVIFAARSLITSAFQMAYVYTPEIYPTHLRAVAMGIFSGSGRLGAIITPFVANVLLKNSIKSGLAVYASLSIISTIIGFLFVETKGKHMSCHNENENEKVEKS